MVIFFIAIMTYANNVTALARTAHLNGHEIIVQVPMEPVDISPNARPNVLMASHDSDELIWPSRAAESLRFVETQAVRKKTQANVVELLSPTSGTFRIPPAGTVATYQCEGGKAKIIKYAIETSDRYTLTVKVSGDGKEFGTYRRMTWQMAGTTLFNEMMYKGKVSKGVIGSTNLSAIGIFEKYKINKSKIYVRGFSSIAEPPLPWHDMIMRVGVTYSYQGRPITYTHSITDLSNKLTKKFGRQSIVSMHEVSHFDLTWDGVVWSTSLRTEFAPSLGFAIRQEYNDSTYYKTTCELTSIDGLGAAYISMGQVKPSTSSKIARTNSAAQHATRAPVNLALTKDNEPPILEVAKTIERTSLVAIITGRVVDQSALSEVIINGVPVALDGND